ncbi:MAG: glycosyltransferase family 39 protein [bacterium]|nr:glycosyltransferase family 39 protein [bacterium]
MLAAAGWAAPLLYAVLALSKLRYPGVHFDEMLHVNAALGGLDDTFMNRSITVPIFGQVPLLLMPYIGALKAWITAPIFALFGVSVLTLRLPMIVLTAFALRILQGTLRRPIGDAAASIVVLILAVDPTLLSLTRADSGPVALQFFLTVLAIWAFEHYRRGQRYWYLLVLLASLGFGVFNKLNYIWIVNAFVLAAVLVYGKITYQALRAKYNGVRAKILWVHVGTWLVGLGATAGYYALLSYKFNLGGFLDPDRLQPLVRLQNVGSSIYGLLTGDLFYYYGLGVLKMPGAAVIAVGLTALVVAGFVFYVFAKKIASTNKKVFVFFVVLFGATLAQIFVTRNAVWPWHYATLYPAVTILIVMALKVCAQKLSKAIWLVIPVLLVFYLVTYGAYLRHYGEPTKNVYWSPAIYELIEATQDDTYRYVSIDWGTHTQLLGFSQDPVKFQNASFFINRDPLPTDARELFNQRYLSGDAKPVRFILHAPEHTLFPAARKNFFSLVGGLQAVQLVKTISNGAQPGEGSLFEFYQLR